MVCYDMVDLIHPAVLARPPAASARTEADDAGQTAAHAAHRVCAAPSFEPAGLV